MNSNRFDKLDKSFIILKIKDQDCQIKASFYKIQHQMKLYIYIQSLMKLISVNSFLDYRDCLSLASYAYSLKNN